MFYCESTVVTEVADWWYWRCIWIHEIAMGYKCMTCSDAVQCSLLSPFVIKSPRPWRYILLELPELAVGGPPLFVSLSIENDNRNKRKISEWNKCWKQKSHPKSDARNDLFALECNVKQSYKHFVPFVVLLLINFVNNLLNHISHNLWRAHTFLFVSSFLHQQRIKNQAAKYPRNMDASGDLYLEKLLGCWIWRSMWREPQFHKKQ